MGKEYFDLWTNWTQEAQRNYLEFVFPEKNIRYIAVTENEDTEKGLSDFVPFKNLFNDNLA